MKVKSVWVWLCVVAHSVALMFISYFWLNLPYTYENEGVIIAWSSILKNVVLGFEEKPDRKDFLLVNVGYQKALIPKYDDFGFEIGNEVVTDRKSLSEFFYAASVNNQHKIIVCDVFLEGDTEYDSLLEANVQKTKNVFFPFHREGDEWKKPHLAVPTAFSDYTSDFGNFLKYTYLQHDTCPTVALEMYKTLDSGTYSKRGWRYYKNNGLALNSFIIEFPIRQFDIFRDDTLGYNSIHIQNFLQLPDSMANDLIKDKIIVVGDFLVSDLHQTMYGQAAGPLIHLNAYLNLHDNRNNLSWVFFLYLFSWFFVFSYTLFFNQRLFSFHWLMKLKESKAGGFIFDYLKYAFFLMFMSIISFILFDIHLNVLIISLYFSLAESGVEYFQKKKSIVIS